MTDIRTIRTKDKIRKCFITLLNEMPYEKINVTDIADKAEINRVTFYTHYQDKEELLRDIVDNFAVNVTNEASLLLASNFYDSNPIVNFAIASVLGFIESALKDKALLSNLSKTENYIIYTYFEKSLSQKMMTSVKKIGKIDISPKYPFVMDFLLQGYNSVIFSWLLEQPCSKERFINEMKSFVKDTITSRVMFNHE